MSSLAKAQEPVEHKIYLLLIGVGMFPDSSISVLDTFNRPNEGPPMTGWTDITNGLQVDTLQCRGNAAAPDANASYFTTPKFSTACCDVFVSIANIGDNGDAVYVSMLDPATLNGYAFSWDRNDADGDTLNLVRLDGGVDVLLGSISHNMVNDERIGLRISTTAGTLKAIYIQVALGPLRRFLQQLEHPILAL